MADEGANKGDAGQEEQDLSVFVQNLLTQMQGRFQQMSEAIVTRIDEMGDRIDGLEKSIGELMNQAGVENAAIEGRPAGEPSDAAGKESAAPEAN